MERDRWCEGAQRTGSRRVPEDVLSLPKTTGDIVNNALTHNIQLHTLHLTYQSIERLLIIFSQFPVIARLCCIVFCCCLTILFYEQKDAEDDRTIAKKVKELSVIDGRRAQNCIILLSRSVCGHNCCCWKSGYRCLWGYSTNYGMTIGSPPPYVVWVI